MLFLGRGNDNQVNTTTGGLASNFRRGRRNGQVSFDTGGGVIYRVGRAVTSSPAVGASSSGLNSRPKSRVTLMLICFHRPFDLRMCIHAIVPKPFSLGSRYMSLLDTGVLLSMGCVVGLRRGARRSRDA